MRVLVCASGGGSNFESLVRKSWIYQSYKVCRLFVDRDCGAIEVAERLGIPCSKINENRQRR
jgi:folate-dependent phosphoribosylglycinamide formyltransferase PurN